MPGHSIACLWRYRGHAGESGLPERPQMDQHDDQACLLWQLAARLLTSGGKILMNMIGYGSCDTLLTMFCRMLGMSKSIDEHDVLHLPLTLWTAL
jgi:hypothetical protein